MATLYCIRCDAETLHGSGLYDPWDGAELPEEKQIFHCLGKRPKTVLRSFGRKPKTITIVCNHHRTWNSVCQDNPVCTSAREVSGPPRAQRVWSATKTVVIVLGVLVVIAVIGSVFL